jgi:hypothetical protein
MSVICVVIHQSQNQIVSGIPQTVSITTNVPANIYYTLNGTIPTLFSTIYTGPIFLPFDQLAVVLNVFATNGDIFSPIITETYQTNAVDGNARLPHSATNARPGPLAPNDYPFGNPPYQPNQEYLNPAKVGVTVDNPAKPSSPTAFDGNGNPTAFTNEPYNIQNYQIIYSTDDAEGQIGRNIGNVPGKTTLINHPPPEEQTEQFTNTFDPRAMVVFQDFSKEDPNDPPTINRHYYTSFTDNDPSRSRDGAFFFGSSEDGTPPPSGSLIRAHYNPRTNEITHYYRDSCSNRWIISTSPYQPSGTYTGDLSQAAINNRSPGSRYVQEWIPFARRVLF